MEHRKLKTALYDRGIRMSVVAESIGVSTRALYNKIEAGAKPHLPGRAAVHLHLQSG